MIRLFAIILLIFQSSVLADTVIDGCKYRWDYAVEDEPKIDGYRVYVDSVAVLDIAPSEREGSCADAGLVSGSHSVYVTAFNVTGESPPSNVVSITFVDAPPPAPTTFHFIVTVP